MVCNKRQGDEAPVYYKRLLPFIMLVPWTRLLPFTLPSARTRSTLPSSLSPSPSCPPFEFVWAYPFITSVLRSRSVPCLFIDSLCPESLFSLSFSSSLATSPSNSFILRVVRNLSLKYTTGHTPHSRPMDSTYINIASARGGSCLRRGETISGATRKTFHGR